jgi:dTDP-4-dehydrorhamnose 3,5-epimerase
MKILEATLPGVLIIEPTVYGDDRGFFMETWNARTFRENELDWTFVQDNHSRSGKHILRGLHYQVRQPQGKLVRVSAGRIFDVAVDLRRSSPHFGKWAGADLSAENKRLIWVPPGFAHGFLVLEDNTDVLYKCTDYYAPADEHTILWNDPDLAIEWPLPPGTDPVLSKKDMAGVPFSEAEALA